LMGCQLACAGTHGTGLAKGGKDRSYENSQELRHGQQN
jgi:hypothetical protein